MKTTKILLLSGIFASFGIFASCSDDRLDVGDNSGGDEGASVSFNVSDVQEDASSSHPMPSSTRASFLQELSLQGLCPADLVHRQLPVQSSDGLDACLIESTVAGVNPVTFSDAQTRANISTAITGNFSSIGYRGSSASGIGDRPWFHNKATTPNGKLLNDIRWSWSQPYGRFYGVSPQAVSSYGKLRLSPAGYSGRPYVDFEAERDVKKQKDLMTACSGTVKYAKRFVAPSINLRFRHALTAVRFKVGQNLSYNKTITKVEIIGAMSKGRYTLPADEKGRGASWSGQNTPARFTLGGDGKVKVSTSKAFNQIIIGNAGDNYTFYMIPQKLSGVSVKIYFSDGNTISANLKGQWKPGTTKTYALSEKNSAWEYQLSVTGPSAVDYNVTRAGYTVTSYRKDPSTGTLQPVSWRVVGYDSNNDNKFSMGEKPSWLRSLSMNHGTGGTAAQSGIATLAVDKIVDKLAQRNTAMRNAKPLGSSGSPYDLSTKGGTVARNTANCYVISAPGHYRIPLVYGNAIKDGVTNSHAYKTSSSSGPYVLQHFTNTLGRKITDPWITNMTWPSPEGPVGLKPNRAYVLWADERGLVTNLSVTGTGTNGFVNFEVPKSAIKNGNAVIAVTENRLVVWSWHLWFAPQDVLHPIACTNFKNKVYKFPKEPLGYKYTEWSGTSYSSPRSVRVKVEQETSNGGVKQKGIITVTQNNHMSHHSYATFYQYGRKDALPGIEDVAEGGRMRRNPPLSYYGLLTRTIRHPNIFYVWSELWYNHIHPINLWTMDDDNMVKTIYDPSPAGFKIPTIDAFSGFFINGDEPGTDVSLMNTSGHWDEGWYFNNKITNPDATIFFPALGWRDFRNGNLNDVGVIGFFWVPFLDSKENGYPNGFGNDYSCALGISAKALYLKGSRSSPASGFPVFPVAE